MWFDGSNCEGNTYMQFDNQINPVALLTGDSNTLWYPDTTAPVESIWYRSYRRLGTGGCGNIGGDLLVYPALTMTLPTYTTPFRFEFETCTTPPEPDPEQLIYGCIKNNGTLKIVDDSADCASNEISVTLLSP